VCRLAEELVQRLREIVEYCARPEAGGRTPSDFPLAGLEQSTVDLLAGDGRAVEDIYPLTPTQAGMIFHSLVDGPDAGAYFNHVLLDGWSAAEVFAQVCAEYAAIRDGRDRVPVRRRPFRDYVCWLGERDQEEADRYWREVLDGFTSPTALPYDRTPVEAHRATS